MKNRPPKTIATKLAARLGRAAQAAFLGLVLALAGPAAWAAQVAGVVLHLNGPLLDRKADGTVKVLAAKSEVESGDTLVTEKNTFALIRFVDKGEITLRPNTTFKIDSFAYEDGKPDADSAAFSLVKGGLRSVTGLLGKRNKEKFSLKTPNATIGIRGTTFIVQLVEPGAQGPGAKEPVGGGELAPRQPGAPALPPGLHLAVLDGAIVVSNQGGSQGFQAGQFGFVPSFTEPPVIVPPNQNLQFKPPPSFGPSGPAGGAAGGGANGADGVATTGEINLTATADSVQNQNAVDCIVR